jgi:chromosome segregation ATPase
VSKLETEATIAHETRMAERQAHSKALGDCQLQLETSNASVLALEGKSESLEQANRTLQRSLSESKSQLEDLEQRHHEAIKALKNEKLLTRQLQDSLEMLKLDREQDLLQFEEKLRRINSATGESKQTLIDTETQLSEVTAQLFHHRSSKEKLTLSLQDAEEKCEHIKSEVKRLQDAVSLLSSLLPLLPSLTSLLSSLRGSRSTESATHSSLS